MKFKLWEIVEANTPEWRIIWNISAILIDNDWEEFYYVVWNSSYIHVSLISLYGAVATSKIKKIWWPEPKSD